MLGSVFGHVSQGENVQNTDKGGTPKAMGKEVKLFTEPDELLSWLDENDILMNLSKEDGQILLNYMEGHDYAIGIQEDHMIRKDLSEEDGEVVEYTIDEVIDTVCEWNYELIRDADEKRHNPKDFIDFANEQNRYESLKRDEIRLDRMFDRTIYAKEIETLAVKLANEFISNLKHGKDVEKSVVAVSEEVHRYSTDKRGR